MEFTQRLNALLMNLWGRKCSPRPTPPPFWLLSGSLISMFILNPTKIVTCLTFRTITFTVTYVSLLPVFIMLVHQFLTSYICQYVIECF